MPELPEVETMSRELKPSLTGKIISEIVVFWPAALRGEGEMLNVAAGCSIRDVGRRGKYICLRLDNGFIITIHPRMTGVLLLEPPEEGETYVRALFRFRDGSALYFKDVRKFGRIQFWRPGEPLLPGLGPEPLCETVVFERLSALTSRRPVKSVLLDQKVLAGIGNIYADEVLFRAGIHPCWPANRLHAEQIRRLSRVIPEVLAQATEQKGTTISDYRRPHNNAGAFQFFLKAYGREGEGCYQCGGAVQRMVMNNRSAYFCPVCQPEGAAS